MTIRIEEISFGSAEYKALLALRHEVLRKPIGMVLREKDTEHDAMEFHIAAYDGTEPIGCVLLRPLNATTAKLRQMAVLNAHQGRGIGRRLVAFSEELARSRGFGTIETNARKTAQGFYEKLGFQVASDMFIEVKQHTLVMRKAL